MGQYDWKCTHATSIISQNGDKATIRVWCRWQNVGWTYAIGNVNAYVRCNGSSKTVMSSGNVDSRSVGYDGYVVLGYADFEINKTHSAQSIVCDALIENKSTYATGSKSSDDTNVSIDPKYSYTISYNLNGGSGTSSAQTKWYGENIYVHSAPSKTGYKFDCWLSTVYNQRYSAGAEYGHNANDTLVAQWIANTYTITYNANGGTGGPSTQTKNHNQDVVLSTDIPTRINYNFLGWALTADGGVHYLSGDTCQRNENFTLYAVWELAYTKPRIDIPAVARCTSDGTLDDEGTSAVISFGWSCDRDIQSILVEWTSVEDSGSEEISNTDGNVENYLIGVGAFNPDISYTIHVTVTDELGSSWRETTLGATKFAFDAMPKNEGVALGMPAKRKGYADVGYNMSLNGHTLEDYIQVPSMYDVNTDAEIDSRLENVLATMPDYSVCTVVFNVGADGLGLTAGRWFLTVYKTFYDLDDSSLRYAVITGVCYNNSFTRQRKLYGGVWESWTEPLLSTGFFRFANGWIGMYPSEADAKAWTNRLGWFGFDNSTNTLRLNNETNGGVTQIYANDRIYIVSDRLVEFVGGGGCCYLVSDRFRPNGNDTLYLGDSGNRWKAVYAVNGTIQTSDRNQKEDIEELDPRYIELFKKLTPVSFKFKGGEHDRVHVGFISQDVEAAMDEVGLTHEEFAGYCRDVKMEFDEETKEDIPVLDENGDPIYNYSLRYTEFIALNTRMIQELQKENDILKNTMADLEQRLAALEEKITS